MGQGVGMAAADSPPLPVFLLFSDYSSFFHFVLSHESKPVAEAWETQEGFFTVFLLSSSFIWNLLNLFPCEFSLFQTWGARKKECLSYTANQVLPHLCSFFPNLT